MGAEADNTVAATDGHLLRLIEPVVHEASGHLIYDADGLRPYYDLHAVTEGADYGEPVTENFLHDSERWVARLKPKGSGLKPRDDPNFGFDTVREFSLQVEPADADDWAAPPSVTFTIAPRWPDLESVGDLPAPSNPGDLKGVNIRFDGSNLKLKDYPELLQRGMGAVEVNPDYFTTPHDHSNIWRYEQYLRVDREKAQAVIGDDGPLRRIFELIENEGSFRELREDDRGTVGYHHRVKFDTDGADALISGHVLGKQVKHYHPKHVHGDPSDPLYHPKIGVAFLSQQTDDGSVPWSERNALKREVCETLFNVLSWSGLPVRPNGETYVHDEHFMAETAAFEDVQIVENPLPSIRHEQNTAVVKALSGKGVGNPNLNKSDTATLKVLASGGQRQDIKTLAEAIGRSKRTVYRVVERLNDLLNADNGTVGFSSEYLASKARLGIQGALAALENDEADQAEDSAWGKFVAEYAPVVDERFPDGEADRIELEFGEVPSDVDMREVLRQGFRAWVRSGRDPDDYRYGAARWVQEGTRHSESGCGGMDFLPSLVEFKHSSPLCDVFN